ncbi:sporulation protein YunB [Virgibacillus sp. C22-A2]|uniref:Sporulation protein YunB n=1 Tax=Virgibacillus tibetensis TaxID=3042313 RepID=A0ABU6KJD2_9BACI|nr:sporulation protein YunB [Virgibacillus sp. C22-A2]
MFRKRFKPKSNPPTSLILMITSVLFIVMVIMSIWIVDRGIKPPLMAIAEEKTIEFATRTINAAVKSTESMSFDELVDVSVDNNGNVARLSWNSSAVNSALRIATERAEYFLYGMNKGETLDMDDPDLDPIEYGDTADELADKDPTVVEIPIGQATGSTILANLGPKIPVHFEIVGSIQSDIRHEIQEFGVNAVLFEIFIPVTVNVQIVVPFTTSTAEISTKVFIDSGIIMGEVPDFYSPGGDGPSISIPREDLNND